MAYEPMGVYLNDDLAGATAGLNIRLLSKLAERRTTGAGAVTADTLPEDVSVSV